MLIKSGDRSLYLTINEDFNRDFAFRPLIALSIHCQGKIIPAIIGQNAGDLVEVKTGFFEGDLIITSYQ